MVTITNKETTYIIKNKNETIEVEGEATIRDNNLISSFNGNFIVEGNNYIGNFYYNENEDGTINNHINITDNTIYKDVYDFLKLTIEVLKQKVNEL